MIISLVLNTTVYGSEIKEKIRTYFVYSQMVICKHLCSKTEYKTKGKTMSELYSTTDYSIFKKLEQNREVTDEVYVQRLIENIKKDDGKYLMARPITINEKFEVLDGQHRLEAAKRLGIKIYYIVIEGGTYKDVLSMNLHIHKDWKLSDWLHLHVNLKHPEYIKLAGFLETLGKDYDYIIPFFSGRDKYNTPFKSGDFVFPEEREIRKIKTIIDAFTEITTNLENYLDEGLKKLPRGKTFGRGLIAFLKRKDVVPNILIEKIKTCSNKIKPCVGSVAYQDMFTQIYNFRNKFVIPNSSEIKKLRIREPNLT
jgi:ParB-like nuclease family protein